MFGFVTVLKKQAIAVCGWNVNLESLLGKADISLEFTGSLQIKSRSIASPHASFCILIELMFSSCICWLDFPHFPISKQTPGVLNETFH